MLNYLSSNHALIAAFAPRPARRTRHETLSLNRVFRQAPKLSDYFEQAEIVALKGGLERPISGLAIDSRRVVPGNLFFAISGLRSASANSVDEAISRGAVAVVTEIMPALAPAKATFIQVADARVALARVAQRFFKFPDRDMAVVGVTGSLGKTTVAHLVKYFLNGDQRIGLIGTIHYDLGSRTVPALRTTPESLDVYGLMAQMRDAGCRQAVLEVTTRGIDQKRVLGVQLGAAVFTNFTPSQPDESAGLEADFELQTRLFTGANGPAPKAAVVNLDDSFGTRLLARIPAGARTVTFGENPAAQVRAENVTLDSRRTKFRLIWPAGEMSIDSPLIGRDNLSNLLGAVATAWSLGRDPVVFLAKLRAFKGVPGRLERVEAGQPFDVFVDYARTEVALRHTLGMLRSMTPGRLVVVFGCGGDRDRAKRSLFVRTVQAVADHAVITADNPRREPLAQIFADMRPGVSAPDKISWVADRRHAIGFALDECRPGDCLLIVGKGHESYQEFADTVVPFDDREVVRELIGNQVELR